MLQTYPCHPLLQANRAASVVNAMNRSFTLGIGSSMSPWSSGTTASLTTTLDATPRSTFTSSAVCSMARLLTLKARIGTTHSKHAMEPLLHPVPLLVSALAPRLLKVAGTMAYEPSCGWRRPRRSRV